MPTYEYECAVCHHRFDRFQRISDPPVRKCPECGGRTRRLPGAGAGILFKGSGFYQTDYRSESYKAAAAKEKNATGASAAGSGSKDASTTAKKAAE